jgi:CBS domain-containing protein
VEPDLSSAHVGEAGVIDAATGATRRWIAVVEDICVLDRYLPMVAETAGTLLRAGVAELAICRALTSLHDALVVRLIDLARVEFGPPPCPFAWIALGSGGRMEQSLYTDQDHAVVYPEDAAVEPYFAALGVWVVDGLARAGLRRCSGGYMADRWHMSLPSWRELFRGWLARPEPQALVEAEVFLDFRRVSGALSLQPLTALQRQGAGTPLFLIGMARAAVRFPPPRRLVGPFLRRRGEVDLKRAGLSALVLLARLYALAAGSLARSTTDRLAAAASAGMLGGRSAADLAEAYRLLVGLRLAAQLRQIEAGQAPSNRIQLADLTADERAGLRQGLRAIRNVQRVTELRFRTDTVL